MASGSPWLWDTGVEVIGSFTAFQAEPGRGRGSVTHSVNIVIPRTAVLGQPFQVRVYAADVWLRVAAAPLWTSLPVMDRTPPRVLSVTTSLSRQPPSLAGQYGVGDSIKVYADVADNHGVAYMVYEFAPMGVRDSVAVGGRGSSDPIRIPLGTALAGATGFRLWFRDASGNRTADVVAAPGAVRVYPVRDAAVRTVQVPGRVQDIAVDPARNRLYALIVSSRELRVHSLPGLELVRTVTLPTEGIGLDLTADGDSLLISNGTRTLVAMHVDATVAPAHFNLQGVLELYGIRIGSNGRAIALARMDDGRTAVLEVDMAARTRRVIVASATVPEARAGVARSRDRRKMLLGAGCVFDVQTEQVGVCRTMGRDGRYGPVSGGATGDAWGRMYELFGAGLHPVWSLDEQEDFGVDVVPLSGGSAYMAGRRGLLRVRADGTVAERFTSTPMGTLRLADNGTLMAGAIEAQSVFRIAVVDPR